MIKMPDLKIMNYNGWGFIQSSRLSIHPYFQNILRTRVNRKLCSNIVVTGEPGIGKSYLAIDIARVFEGIYKSKTTGEIRGRFKPEQIVFTHSDYMNLLITLKMGKGIVFDEPSYAMGKRDWFKDLQKVLVHTMESQRFLVHPLWIPIINQSLLDKTIRSYLIQFHIHVIGRGHGWVYQLEPSQTKEKVYRKFICELFYRQFDSHLCCKDSCLGCPELVDLQEPCQLFRAQYERKKRTTQHARYEQAKDQAQEKESSELTDEQIEGLIIPNLAEFISERSGKLDVHKMNVWLRKRGHRLSRWKLHNIKGNIEAVHPEMFEDARDG